MKKQCNNCKIYFQITREDEAFYQKIGVPPPTFCPDCRYQRRLAHRNERVLYLRKCSATGKEVVSIYPQDAPFPVYDQTYWRSDKWDALSYGREFDFSRPFFEQFYELRLSVPRINVNNSNSVNSPYTNQSEYNKDCYLLVSSSYNERVLYSTWAQSSKDSTDVYNLFHGEYCYESVNCQKSSRLFWCLDTENSFDCWFSFDLKGCNNCFLSSSLRNKSYYWQNKPLAKEEYRQKIEELKTSSLSEIETLKKQWKTLIDSSIHRFAKQKRVQDVSGDMLFECKNVQQSFNIIKGENVKYSQDCLELKDCLDATEIGFTCALNYEVQGDSFNYYCIIANQCDNGRNIYYCDLCFNIDYSFGCVGLQWKKYCILNKQYSKSEYEALVPQIIEHMKKSGEFGEYFPASISVFGYNETTANEYFPITKEEVLAKGWKWQDNLPGTYGKEIISPQNIPDDSKEIKDDILKDILACVDCKRNYRLIHSELAFYRTMSLPIPRLCPNCRHCARLALRNPRKLREGECTCQKTNHVWHSKGKCTNTFLSPHSPNDKKIVYCEKCYQQEVI